MGVDALRAAGRLYRELALVGEEGRWMWMRFELWMSVAAASSSCEMTLKTLFRFPASSVTILSSQNHFSRVTRREGEALPVSAVSTHTQSPYPIRNLYWYLPSTTWRSRKNPGTY